MNRVESMRRLLFFCLAGVVLLSGVEVGFRLWLGSPNPAKPERIDWACKRDPHLGYVFVPGAVGPGGPGANSINSLGFRGPEISLEKPPGTYRILCVGDSITNGVNVHNDTTYPGILQRLFDAEPVPGLRVEVVNAGVAGYLSDHQRYRMARDFARLKPDCLVFLMGECDVSAALLANETWQAVGRPKPMAISWLDNAPVAWAADHSALAFQLKGWLERAVIAYRLGQTAKQDLTERLTAALALYRANMEAMLAECRTRGIRVVLVNYPWNFSDKVGRDDNFNEVKGLIKAHEFNLYWQGAPLLAQANRELAAAWGIPFVDPQPVLYALADRRQVFDDFIHPNKKGNFLLAHGLAVTLRRAVFGLPAGQDRVPYDLVVECLVD